MIGVGLYGERPRGFIVSWRISKIADELEMHALFDSDTAPAFEQVTVPVGQEISDAPASSKLEKVAAALEQEITNYQKAKDLDMGDVPQPIQSEELDPSTLAHLDKLQMKFEKAKNAPAMRKVTNAVSSPTAAQA